MTKETKLIGYRRLKSYRITDAGPFDLELGSFSIWDIVCFLETRASYRIWLDLKTLDTPIHEFESTCETETEEEAKQTVLDHISESYVSKHVYSRSGALLCFTTAFSRISPDTQSELLQSMEVRI